MKDASVTIANVEFETHVRLMGIILDGMCICAIPLDRHVPVEIVSAIVEAIRANGIRLCDPGEANNG